MSAASSEAVGAPAHVLVIAEAGVNHNGDVGMAHRLVDAAAAAGADYVKFQTFSADALVARHAKKADYQAAATGAGESQHAMLRRLELSRAAHGELLAHCRDAGVGFLSTGFDEDSVEFLVRLGIDRIKVPSGELTNLPYLRAVGGYRMPVILSTGMAVLGEIDAALDVLAAAGTPRDHVTVLHCSTEYPTPMHEVNLRAMDAMRVALGVKVGYSDHTEGIEIPIAAAALGATVIEKHFTVDRALPGPDQRASLEPDELRAMVHGIRSVEQALGDGRKRPTGSEQRNKSIARRSLVAARAIRAGEPFDVHNVAAKRPGTGISPMRWDEVIGRVAPRDFAPDELLEL